MGPPFYPSELWTFSPSSAAGLRPGLGDSVQKIFSHSRQSPPVIGVRIIWFRISYPEFGPVQEQR